MQAAKRAGRPIEYLNSPTICKEELARHIAQRDHISSGLIALFAAVERCFYVWKPVSTNHATFGFSGLPATIRTKG